jgi:hypothetical protein
MTDISPLSSFETATLTEAVRFLFEQATDLLGRWRRARGPAAPEPTSAAAEAPVLAGVLVPAPLGGLSLPQREALAELRRRASDYVDGVLAVSLGDPKLVATVEELRTALETALGQHITFRGELGRPLSGTPLTEVPSARNTVVGSLVVSGERAIGVNDNSGIASSGDGASFR